jgi:uncharacterized protein YxjI
MKFPSSNILLARAFLSIFFLSVSLKYSCGQDVGFARQMVDSLTAQNFLGRGYVDGGMKKAADFIAARFSSFGLKPLSGTTFFQDFSYSVNRFPGKMDLKINGKKLRPGKDFIVMPGSAGRNISGKLVAVDSIRYVDREQGLLVELTDKLTWSVSQDTMEFCGIQVLKSSTKKPPSEYKLHIENEFIDRFEASNVCARVKGTEQPDSFIFFTAHYDHLGAMGADTYFPGANDNASGIALLLNLARWYALHPSRYSIGFICFAGEEAGLVGSRYFTENPLVSLSRIRFLLNTDLAGTGEEGITVVNATEFPSEFSLMQSINKKYGLLAAVNPRGKAANSDHYFFSEKGVPAFFFYTLGGIRAYHDIYDRPETLPLSEHEDLFRLMTLFVDELTRSGNNQ